MNVFITKFGHTDDLVEVDGAAMSSFGLSMVSRMDDSVLIVVNLLLSWWTEDGLMNAVPELPSPRVRH